MTGESCISSSSSFPSIHDQDIEMLDSKLWPTDYTLNKLRQLLANKLSNMLSVPSEHIFDLLERPKREEHGLFSLPLPQLKFPSLNSDNNGNNNNGTNTNSSITNPVQKAKELAESFPIDDQFFPRATSVGPFLNISGNSKWIMKETIKQVHEMKTEFGKNNIGQGKKVLVEYSSVNIAKPFHAGHLRTTIIGNFLKLAYRANGFDTLGMNYLGDWGKQYGLLAIGWKKYGDESKLEQDPIQHLFDVYVSMNADAESDEAINEQAKDYFTQMEKGNSEALSLWRKFKDLSLKSHNKIYKRLNVDFDIISGESLYDSHMKKSVDEMKSLGLLQTHKEAQVINLESSGLGTAIILKKDGSSLYLTRDIAAAQDRFDTYKLDKSIYVVACQQDLHLAQLFKIMELMKKPWAHRMKHINFGMVKGMKTRKGQVVFLEDVIDQARDVMHSVMQKNPEKYGQVENPMEISDKLAVSAIVIQDFSAKRIKDYEFKLDRVIQFEGDTGPYLQYAHSRLCSLERKTGLVPSLDNLDLLTEKEAQDLAIVIARYPDVVQECRITAEPCVVVNYLMSLSRQVSTALDRMWVMGQEKDLAQARLALYSAAKFTIGNGLRLLGLEPLERM